MDEKRFFLVPYIVSYNLQGYPANKFEGTITAITQNNSYVNRKAIIESIIKDLDGNFPNLSIQFTNIIELSESDYNDWIA